MAKVNSRVLDECCESLSGVDLEAVFGGYLETKAPAELVALLKDEGLLTSGMFARATAECAKKKLKGNEALLVLALYFFSKQEPEGIAEMLAVMLAKASLANCVLWMAANLVMEGRDQEVFDLLGGDCIAHTMAGMLTSSLKALPGQSKGGSKGGGHNKLDISPEKVLMDFNAMNQPEHDRVGILAKRYGCSDRTVRNRLKQAQSE